MLSFAFDFLRNTGVKAGSAFSGRTADRIILLISILLSLLILMFFLAPVSENRIRGLSSPVLLSEEGIPLRIFRDNATGSYKEWISLSAYPLHLKRAVLAAEDKRFYYHPGIDPAAMLRSFYLNMMHMRVVSGASTITQQLIRIMYSGEIPANSYLRKLFEILYSVRLEMHYTKNEILEAYLNRIPLRYNRLGMAAASRNIFHKSPEFLTEEECAALAVLIRQSNVSRENFLRRYIHLSKLLYENKIPGPEETEGILSSVFNSVSSSQPVDLTLSNVNAPHFSEWMQAVFSDFSGNIHTGISANLTEEINRILDTELKTLQVNNAGNGAVVVLELVKDRRSFSKNAGLILRAMVGSRDFNSDHAGQVNGATAYRNAGSTLKPFIYALAMDRHGLKSYSILDDSEVSFNIGDDGELYQPKNYDLNFWGKITLRESLAASRNIPAVKLLRETGVEEFYELLKKMNVDHMQNSPDFYGPGMALGTAGISLLDLTRLYSVFPGEGTLHPLEIGYDDSGKKYSIGTESKIFSEDVSCKITDILSDRDIRRKAFGKRSFLDFPFDVAAKTGTSKDYRDAWTVGYTSRYIVGVWVGNFSGDAMQNISGVFGAGRIFHEVVRLLVKDGKHKFKFPEDWRRVSICRITGRIAGENCPSQPEMLSQSESDPEICDGNHSDVSGENIPHENMRHEYIKSPRNGDVYFMDPHSPADLQGIPLEINFENKALRYAIDGKMFSSAESSSVKKTLSLKEGLHRIEVYQNYEMIERIEFEVRNSFRVKK